MSQDLGAEGYRKLLGDALPGIHDADTVNPSLSTLFTPASHRLALDPDTTVVKGGRGVGKTFWFRSLLQEDLRAVAAQAYNIPRLRQLKVVPGYGASLLPDQYPGPGELRKLVSTGIDPLDLWTTVALVALEVPALKDISTWSERIAWVQSNPSDRDRAFSAADKSAQERQGTQLILFDALEHLHSDRQSADRLVAGILRLALELRLSTRSLRAKIFIRPDMFDGAMLHFPDASKLSANAASLKWTPVNLYGLLFHHLGNQASEEAESFRGSLPGWTQSIEKRYVPPVSLLGDSKYQDEVFRWFAGPYMGTNYRKGHTYTWLPNHLMDGAEQVSPRSFLSALSKALEVTRDEYASHRYALHSEGIRRGVQAASATRVQEIKEDLPWVQIAIEPLEGQQVPIEEDVVIDLWEAAELTDSLRRQAEQLATGEDNGTRAGPRYPDRYKGLIGELIDLGVMRRRKDGRIDLPDVYRIAFSVGRKGGVPKATA